MKRVLDRLPEVDPRSKLYPVMMTISSEKFRNYTWPCKTWNDQGSEGACVGFAYGHELAAIPFSIFTNNEISRQIYKLAQEKDEYPGNSYEGTSILGGVKAVKEIYPQAILEYRHAETCEDLARAVGLKGPAVLGVNWYSDMFNPDAKGFIHASGYVAGGHAILCRGVSVRYVKTGDKINWYNVDKQKSYFVLHNSWGVFWGVNGTCKINFEDMERLLSEQGEAIIPIRRNK